MSEPSKSRFPSYTPKPKQFLTVPCSQAKWEKFWYVRDVPNNIMAIAEEMETLMVSPKLWEELAPENGDKITVPLTSTGITLQAPSDVERALFSTLGIFAQTAKNLH